MESEYYLEETFQLISDFKSHLVKERNLSKQTSYNYGLDLKTFFEWADKPYDEIVRQTVIDFIRALADRGQEVRTRNRRLSSIKTFFNYLIEIDKVSMNPAAEIKNAKLDQKLPKPVDLFDIEIIFDTVSNPRDNLIFELMYSLGCRREELISIRRRDINFRSKQIRLIGKGNKERIVPIHDEALSKIKDFLQTHNSEWLFPSNQYKTKHLSCRALNKIVSKCVKEAGLEGKGITPHKFRHSFGTHMFEGGADIKAVADMMGHANVNTTQVYTKVSHSRNQKEYASAHPRAKMQKQPH
ncbi:tyrosine-type recombinase/integrase (plasmid) [Paenibacillus sp. S-38]|uniref:tyrosine-type recombinase/integrase n=1 Tax=Paenibacillus sp. S-38 TaxID=3416710 RepID=UPI003CF011D8